MPRASTDNDDRLDQGMRPTELSTAVEIDHEAKAAAQHKVRKATEDVRTGGNRTVGDVTDPNVASSSDLGTGSFGEPGESTDVGLVPAPADDDLNTAMEDAADGPVRTATQQHVNEPIHHNATMQHHGGGPVDLNATMQHEGGGPVDLNATMEQNPRTDFNAAIGQSSKTPLPTLSRPPSVVATETPVPTLSRAPSVAATETPMPTRAASVPISTAPSSLPPPKETSAQTSGPTPACPQCESPMAWVDEHLRFYCKSCRMYF